SEITQETLVAYSPATGPNGGLGILGEVALDMIHGKIYFIDQSHGFVAAAGIEANTKPTNNIYVANINGGPNQATSLLQLTANASIANDIQGVLSGLAINPTTQTLYFST